jgi:hypothetical protein
MRILSFKYGLKLQMQKEARQKAKKKVDNNETCSYQVQLSSLNIWE